MSGDGVTFARTSYIEFIVKFCHVVLERFDVGRSKCLNRLLENPDNLIGVAIVQLKATYDTDDEVVFAEVGAECVVPDSRSPFKGSKKRCRRESRLPTAASSFGGG